MADEIVTNVETPDPTGETNQVKTIEEKVFKQADVDRIVKERLEREKATAKKTVEDITNEKVNLEKTLAEFEGIIKKFVEDNKKENIPDMYLGIFNKLSLMEQYEFLNDPKNKLAPKKAIPETPRTNDKVDEKSNNKKIKKFL